MNKKHKLYTVEEAFRMLLGDEEYEKNKAEYPAYKKKMEQLYRKEIAKKVKKARIISGLTQSELGKRIGQKKQYISSIETGKRNITLSTLHKVVFALEGKLKIEIEV